MSLTWIALLMSSCNSHQPPHCHWYLKNSDLIKTLPLFVFTSHKQSLCKTAVFSFIFFPPFFRSCFHMCWLVSPLCAEVIQSPDLSFIPLFYMLSRHTIQIQVIGLQFKFEMIVILNIYWIYCMLAYVRHNLIKTWGKPKMEANARSALCHIGKERWL